MKLPISAFLLALAALPAAAQGADTFITITAGAPRASERCGAQEADFTLHAGRDLTLEQRTITGVNNDGEYIYGSRTSHSMKRGDTQKLNACISETIPALEICAKADGQEKCWSPAYSGEDGALVLAPGFALAPSAAPDAATLQGAWDDKVSGRCHMRIVRIQGDELDVEVNWSDSAAVNYRWRFSGTWDKAQQQLTYTNGTQVRRESQDNWSTAQEKLVWSEGTGTLSWSDGALYWHDAKEQVCKDCIFQRAER